MEVEGEAVEWNVVSRKKGGKCKPTKGVVQEQPSTDFLSKTESRKDDLYGSPSMRSVRSGASTKDTETGGDEPDLSLLGSPALLSSCSEASTDALVVGLDEFASTEESCSLQGSPSGSSLEVTAALDVCDVMPHSLTSKASNSRAKSKAKDAAADRLSEKAASGHSSQERHLPGTLSHAIQRCTASEEGTSACRRGASAHNAVPVPTVLNPPVAQEAISQTKSSNSAHSSAACQKGKKAPRQQLINSCGNNGHIVGSPGISDPVKAQATPDKKAAHTAKHQSKTHAVSDLSPLGSTWLHNGRRDEGAVWNLLLFQPLWSCSSPDEPHVPVSVQTVEAGVRLVDRRTFLDMEQIVQDTPPPRRAHSLDGSHKGTKS